MIEGYCTACRADVPVSDQRCCLADGSLCIPPSWSRAGAPFPWPPRRQARVTRRTIRTAACDHCGATFPGDHRGGSPRVYCSDVCGQQALNARRRQRRAAERDSRVVAPTTCRQCGDAIPPAETNGRPRTYCGNPCTRETWRTATGARSAGRKSA